MPPVQDSTTFLFCLQFSSDRDIISTSRYFKLLDIVENVLYFFCNWLRVRSAHAIFGDVPFGTDGTSITLIISPKSFGEIITGGKYGFVPNLDISREISFSSPVVRLKFQSLFSIGTSRILPEYKKMKFCFFLPLKKSLGLHSVFIWTTPFVSFSKIPSKKFLALEHRLLNSLSNCIKSLIEFAHRYYFRN